ncbi:hypothetical protein KIMH_15360 [Bombiscardovia apis]|uniref:Nudix hydrolase domain-containing protein n=1 Tax=Bombiscardovia apis TaxID=2932182 RepID=A0ABM8BF38_9BIFI|nr:NUDIX hydrolase [Bombiscardovia apis]BDR55425.1 hypothetical protein KIMH_15360 [Bombiscardovia apis]
MTTPTDLARMMSRHAKGRGNHANSQEETDRLLHTVGEDVDSALEYMSEGPGQSRKPESTSAEEGIDLEASADEVEAEGPQTGQLISVSIREPSAENNTDADADADMPTPAVMPQHKQETGPTSFASLETQDLPVVREYSAGGLIFDDSHRVAIIARHSRSGHLEWCLPKGHIEKGETPEQTAVREVHEETGILGEVVDSIATIDYWFTGTNQRVHKLVHHFVLQQTGGDLTVEGDPDHEAENAIWVKFEDLADVLSYPNERKIAWLYAKKTKNTDD